MNKHRGFHTLAAMVFLLGLLPLGVGVRTAQAANSRYFPETGHTVQGLFLTYWDTHGGLAQQGYPISEELQEVSDTDGQVYTMQYFERAVFEYHPENKPPYNVLLSLLGTFYYNEKYGGNAPGQKANPDSPRHFTETGKTIGGAFRQYWETHGGLAQQGYPISDEFQEVSPTDGNTYTVQYFQRAVFEYHPEKQPPYNVLLSLLGVFYYGKKHGVAPPPITPVPTTVTTGPTATPTTPPAPVGTVGWVLLYNQSTGGGELDWVDEQGTIFPKFNYNFGTGWTHVVSANGDNHVVLFYNTNTGAAMTYLLDGSEGDKKTYGFGPGFTQIAPLGGSQVGYNFFYNGNAGGAMTGMVHEEGTFTYVNKNVTFGSGFSLATGASNGPLLMYVRSNGNGLIGNIKSDGTFLQLQSYTTFSRTWTHIIQANNGILLFSSQDDGTGATGRMQFNGTFSTLHTYGFSKGWSGIAAMTNYSVMFYNSTSGLTVTGRLDENGVFTQQKTLNLDTGWSHVTAIR